MKQAGQQKAGAASFTGLTMGPQPSMMYGAGPMGMRLTPEQIALGMAPMGVMRPTQEYANLNCQAMMGTPNTPYIVNPHYVAPPLSIPQREPFGFGTTKTLYNPMHPMNSAGRRDGYSNSAFKFPL